MEVYLGNQGCNLGKVLSSILDGFVSNTTFFSSGVFCFLGFGILLLFYVLGWLFGEGVYLFLFFFKKLGG